MATIDVVLGLLALFALASGWRSGLLRQAGSLAGVAVAWALSRWLAPAEPGLFIDLLPEALRGTAVGAYVASTGMRIAVFAAAYLAVYFTLRLAHVAIKAVMLGPLNSLLGAAASLFKWMLAASLALNLWICLKPANPGVWEQTMEGSVFVGTVTRFAPWLWDSLSNLDNEQPATQPQLPDAEPGR